MAAETYLCNANRLSSRPVPRDRRGFPQAVIPAIGSRRPFCHLLAVSAGSLRALQKPSGLDAVDLRELQAGEGNRTLVFSLEGYCSTIELHPQFMADSLWRPGPSWVLVADRGLRIVSEVLGALRSVPGIYSCRIRRCLWGVPVARVCLAQAAFFYVFGRRTGSSPCRVCRSPSLRRPRCRRFKVFGHLEICYWGVQDSNLRRQCHQIYSLTPLATRETPR
jgi:hypothetical protein